MAVIVVEELLLWRNDRRFEGGCACERGVLGVEGGRLCENFEEEGILRSRKARVVTEVTRRNFG